ncbi:hypothetical protein VZC37_13440 [Gordonia sp. LSe1-13]|uniref:Uncharacterized protein n=1 Tax=Gordonia sesuvii TaxID=3116777 RepID=A0ABU7ME31_9ACTN|nr:hypothetical protein [Gordonia sp. LSe1-13]
METVYPVLDEDRHAEARRRRDRDCLDHSVHVEGCPFDFGQVDANAIDCHPVFRPVVNNKGACLDIDVPEVVADYAVAADIPHQTRRKGTPPFVKDPKRAGPTASRVARRVGREHTETYLQRQIPYKPLRLF